MMRMFPRAAAAAVPFLLACPAVAQDAGAGSPPAYDASPSREDTPFTGLYAGGSIGYDVQSNNAGASVLFDRNLDGRFGDTVTTATGANAFSPGFCSGQARGALRAEAGGCRKNKDGLGYAARVGLDHQTGAFVVGVVGEFGRSEIRDSVSAFSTTPANYVLTRSIDWEASVRGRAGFAANTTLFYATGGVGYAKIDNDYSSTNTANAFTTNGNSKEWGVLAGGGIEQKIGRNFSIGLEYMYHRYQDDDFRVRTTRGTAPATNPFVLPPNTAGTDFRRSDRFAQWHSMRATAAFRF